MRRTTWKYIAVMLLGFLLCGSSLWAAEDRHTYVSLGPVLSSDLIAFNNGETLRMPFGCGFSLNLGYQVIPVLSIELEQNLQTLYFRDPTDHLELLLLAKVRLDNRHERVSSLLKLGVGECLALRSDDTFGYSFCLSADGGVSIRRPGDDATLDCFVSYVPSFQGKGSLSSINHRVFFSVVTRVFFREEKTR